MSVLIKVLYYYFITSACVSQIEDADYEFLNRS